MTFMDTMRALLSHRANTHLPGAFPIYIYLPEDLDPLERHARYEDVLENELQVGGLGRVTGGGSMEGEEQEDGACPALFSGIDVEVIDVNWGRSRLRDLLPEIDCPPGTRLLYRLGGIDLQDEFDGESWALERRRTDP